MNYDFVTGQPLSTGMRTYDPSAWGGRRDDIDPVTGEYISGTSGAQRDVTRYWGMGAKPNYQSGPQIDQGQADVSRRYQMGSLGLLESAMNGRTPSAAEQAGTAQAQAAGNAQVSMGNSVRGGAMARAGAARIAAQNAGTIMQQQAGANAATRAGEMASAREDYFGQVSGMRGQDLQVATDQAKLDAAQKGANDQREGFYEDLAHKTKVQDLNARAGRSASDQAAAQRQSDQNQQLQNQQRQNAQAALRGGAGAAGGAARAIVKAYGSDDDDDDSLSDEKTKQGVKSMSPGKRVRSRTNDIVRDNPYDPATSYDRSMFAKTGPGDADTQKLHAGIEKLIAADNPPPIIRENPYGPDKGMLGAPRGYAKSRAGQPGSPTGPEAKHGFEPKGTELAPGTEDFEKGSGPVADPGSRRIMGLPQLRKPVNSEMRTTLSPGEAKKNIKPVKSKQDEEDEAEIRKFLGLKPGEKIPEATKVDDKTAEEERRKGEELAMADRAREQKSREDAINKQRVAYVNESDAKGQRLAQSISGVPFFGRWAKEKADSRSNETDAQKIARADAMKRDEISLNEKRRAVDSWARKFVPDSILKKQDAAPVAAGWRPPTSWEEQYDAKHRKPAAHNEVVPLMDRGDEKLQMGTGAEGKAFYAREEQEHGGASLSGSQPRFGRGVDDRAAPPKAAPAAPRALTPDEMARMAQAQIENTRAQQAASDEYGPAVRDRDIELSDERAKQGAREDSPMHDANLAMRPYEYEYRDEFRGQEGQKPGEKNVGPMAQNMAKDPVASTAITTDDATGLMAIDKSKGLKLVMGGLADLQRQVDDMKRRRA